MSQAQTENADTTPTRTAGLYLRDIVARYGAHSPVVHDVDIDVPAGTTVALLGANGAGKTTILRAITGLLPEHGGKIERGTVRLDERDITSEPPHARVDAGIAQVLEGRRVFQELTVDENIRSGAIARKARRTDIEDDLEGIYARFPDLADRRGEQAGYLSGGQQQMVAIGRALMARPRVLLLDEPSLGLAPKVVEYVGDVVRQIGEQGISVLMIEQNATLALSLADYAYVLENGRITVHGRSADLAADDRVRQAYLGV